MGLAPGGTAPGFEITAARPTDREGDGIAGRQSLSDQSPAWVVARGNQSWPSYAPFDPPPPRRISQAEIVICSLPLGVLKADTCPVFDPPLPPRKLQAVERLGFGTLNKVGGGR